MKYERFTPSAVAKVLGLENMFSDHCTSPFRIPFIESTYLLFQNFKPICKNIGNAWRDRQKTVEKWPPKYKSVLFSIKISTYKANGVYHKRQNGTEQRNNGTTEGQNVPLLSDFLRYRGSNQMLSYIDCTIVLKVLLIKSLLTTSNYRPLKFCF